MSQIFNLKRDENLERGTLNKDNKADKRVKNYCVIYQRKSKKKFPTISFYNLLTKKMSAF